MCAHVHIHMCVLHVCVCMCAHSQVHMWLHMCVPITLHVCQCVLSHHYLHAHKCACPITCYFVSTTYLISTANKAICLVTLALCEKHDMQYLHCNVQRRKSHNHCVNETSSGLRLLIMLLNNGRQSFGMSGTTHSIMHQWSRSLFNWKSKSGQYGRG